MDCTKSNANGTRPSCIRYVVGHIGPKIYTSHLTSPPRSSDGAHIRKLQAVLASLGAHLIFAPDSPKADAITRLYHSVCAMLHAAEEGAQR
jgi:hypothetical protein